MLKISVPLSEKRVNTTIQAVAELPAASLHSTLTLRSYTATDTSITSLVSVLSHGGGGVVGKQVRHTKHNALGMSQSTHCN